MGLSAVRAASAAALAGVLVLGLVAPGPTAAAGPVLLVLAAVAGLPHGAADVLLLLRAGSRSRLRSALPLLAYAVVAAAAVLLTLAFPTPALAALLVLSVAHFAEGEAAFDRLTGGAGSRLSAAAVATAVVALPVAVHPAQVRPLLEPLAPALAGLLLSGPGRLLLGVAAGGLVGAALVLGRGTARAEVALVAAVAVTAPPLVAFAAWFAGWHAVRHVGRLLAVDERPGAPARLLRAAALPSLGGLALLGVLVWTSGTPGPAVLLGLLALTVPHAVVVERVLGRRGLSTAPQAGRGPGLRRREALPL